MQKKYLNLLRDKKEFLCSAIITDVCDRLGIDFHLISNINTRSTNKKIVGLARTLTLSEEKHKDDCDIANLSVGIHLLHSLSETDVLFVKGSEKFAYFGELMGRFCERQNVEGVVIDGFTRDSFSFEKYSYGIFFRGTTPLDIVGRGSVKSSDESIHYDNFVLNSGDFVFSDLDATVIVPIKRIGDLYAGCVSEIEEEMLIKRKIDDGMSILDIIKNSKPL